MYFFSNIKIILIIIRINKNVHIMENTVIHTAGSIPTGIPSIVEIGN